MTSLLHSLMENDSGRNKTCIGIGPYGHIQKFYFTLSDNIKILTAKMIAEA